MKPLALPRNVAPIAWVTLLHVAAIGALATHNFSEVRESQPVEITVELGSEVLTATASPAPLATTAPKAAPVHVAKPTQADPTPETPTPTPTPTPTAMLATDTSNAEAANALPTAKAASAESRPGPASAISANANTATTHTPLPATNVQLPSSDADYLNNPEPAYPPMSRRLGEHGTVIVRALIGADGIAQKAEVQQSSGFARLDRSAVETALQWRYLPGKRAGVPEAMWFNVPLRFVLE